jgi:hypothetical protein
MFIGKIVDRMDTCHPTSKKIKAKYEDATKTNTVAKLNFVYYIIAQNLKYSFNKVNTV